MGCARSIVPAVLLLGFISGCGQNTPGPSQPPTVQPPMMTGHVDVYTPPTVPPPATCPTSGIGYSAGPVEAALGHRGVVVTLQNCGKKALQINGYPAVRVLDAGRQPLDVRVKQGSSYMAIDPGPKSVSLSPGMTLLTVVSWSATVTDGPTVTGAALSIATLPAETPQILPVQTDLGTTGEIAVTGWDGKVAR